MNKTIDSFSGDYDFLSNFYPCSVIYDGYIYPSSEAAFQAAKCIKRSERLIFTQLSPNEAKKLGRKVELREDWEGVKNKIMLEIVINKFVYNPKLAQKLLDTGETRLVEGNTWNDTYWGVCNGVGKNHLGAILMEARSYLRSVAENYR